MRFRIKFLLFNDFPSYYRIKYSVWQVIKYPMNLRGAPVKSGVLQCVSALHKKCEFFHMLHLRHLVQH